MCMVSLYCIYWHQIPLWLWNYIVSLKWQKLIFKRRHSFQMWNIVYVIDRMIFSLLRMVHSFVKNEKGNACQFWVEDWLIDWLFRVLRPAQEYFTYMETSPLPVKGGLSPSCIALSFDGFGSISWQSIWVFSGSLLISHWFFLYFQLFRSRYQWRDFFSRNAHLMHQNWYRINFTF